MPINNVKTKKRDGNKRFLIKKVAEMHGVSPRTVDRIVNGDSENEEIFSTYMFLRQEQNKLLNAAKELVPFN